jgi:hypothetical protein
MAWTNSKIFRAFIADALDNTVALDLGADAFKVALYNTTPTPDQNVTSANSCYNVGQWVTANEVYQAGQWAQAGVALGTPTLNSATAATVFFDAADTASGSAATLAAVFGCLVYDDTMTSPADQGISYNYFGGTNSVTNGTLTVVWHANGIFRITL